VFKKLKTTVKSLLPHGFVRQWHTYKQQKLKSAKDPKRARMLADESLGEDEKQNLWDHGFYPLEKELYSLNEDNFHLYLDYRSYRKLHPINGRFSSLIDSKEFLPVILNDVPNIHVVLNNGRVRYCKGVDRRDAIDQLQDYITSGGELVTKPHGGSGGKGFCILTAENFGREIDRRIESGESYIINEKIEQHFYARSLFPDALNPLRIVVMRDVETGNIFLVSAAQHVGTRQSAPVSNAGAGGLIAPIDPESGSLCEAVRYVGGYGSHTFHPDTEEPIQGAEIPEWDRLISEIMEAVDAMQWLDYAGLDVAVTPEGGFTVLEINSLPGLASPQILDRPLLARSRVRQFFEQKGLGIKDQKYT
jgi:hypothetical protein